MVGRGDAVGQGVRSQALSDPTGPAHAVVGSCTAEHEVPPQCWGPGGAGDGSRVPDCRARSQLSRPHTGTGPRRQRAPAQCGSGGLSSPVSALPRPALDVPQFLRQFFRVPPVVRLQASHCGHPSEPPAMPGMAPGPPMWGTVPTTEPLRSGAV